VSFPRSEAGFLISGQFRLAANERAGLAEITCLEKQDHLIFCTKWSVSVTPRWTFVRSHRRGCGDVGNAKRFPYLHAPVGLITPTINSWTTMGACAARKAKKLRRSSRK
jgi:hypothetical protein